MPKNTFFNLPEEKKQRIIDTAYDEYLNKPYEEVTVRSIVEKADIPIGSFYKYFEDKDELYLYLNDEIIEKLKNATDYVTDYIAIPPNIDEKMFLTEREIKLTDTFYSAPIEIVRRFYFGSNKIRIIEMYEGELKEYKDQGKLRDGVDIQLTAYMYASTMYNLFTYFRENNITDNDERWKIKKELYFGIFTHGILKSEKDSLRLGCEV